MLTQNDYYLIGHVLAVKSYLHLANVAHVREMVLVAMDTAWMVIRQDISKHGWSSVRIYCIKAVVHVYLNIGGQWSSIRLYVIINLKLAGDPIRTCLNMGGHLSDISKYRLSVKIYSIYVNMGSHPRQDNLNFGCPLRSQSITTIIDSGVHPSDMTIFHNS
jgi:hypothetical protein